MSRAIRWTKYLIYISFLFVLIEITCRVFWSVTYQVPFWPRHHEILKLYYPELKQLDPPVQTTEDRFDVLLLGASVFDERWQSSIPAVLSNTLSERTQRQVNIYNMGRAGHTTRDSLIKYEVLSEHHFDLIIFYHGINEVRTNHASPEKFKADYSHYVWYNLLNDWYHYPLKKILFFPYALKFLVKKAAIKNGWIFRVPENPQLLSQDLLNHAADIKSHRPFRHHMERIIQIAQTRQEPILLLKYLFYLPSNYHLSKFISRDLDYGSYISPVEVWGRPDNVLKGLKAHNQVIESIAHKQAGKGVYYLDLDGVMPKNGKHFNDICHLAENGAAVFVTQIAEFLGSQNLLD